MADGSIVIDTSVNTSGFNKGVASMSKGVASMSKSISGLGSSFKQMMLGLGLVVGLRGFVVGVEAVVAASNKMATSLIGVQSIVEGQGRSFVKAKQFLMDYTKDGLMNIADASRAYKNLSMRGYTEEQIKLTMDILKNTAAFGRQQSLTIGEAVASASEGLRNENSILTDNAGITKNVTMMWRDWAAAHGTTVGAMTQEQKILAEVNGMMEESRYMMGDAAKLAGTFSGRLQGLSVAFFNMKAAIGDALAPILNALIPGIQAAVEWFTYWFNIIGRVMNLLFGTQVGTSSLGGVADDAYDAADAQDELADATGRAGEAAKGALASFDKLNVLAQPAEASGSGGGGGGGEIGLPVEEEGLFPRMEESLDEMEEKIRGFVTRVKEFFAPLGEAFNRLGKSLGNLKDAVVGAFEKFSPGGIDFGPFIILVRDGVIFIIDLLAKALEGLANWINENPEAFELLVKIFAGLAIAVSAVLAPAVLTIAAVLALLAALGWLSNNWDLVKEKAIEAWEKIKLTWETVSTWFSENVTEPVKTFFSDAWDSIKGFFTGAWEKIKLTWETVSTWFSENVTEPVETFFSDAWDNIKGFFTGAWDNIKLTWETVSTWFSENVTEPVKKFFSDAWDDIKGFFTGAWEDIKVVWETVSTWFSENVTEPVKKFFSDVWDDIKGFFTGAWDDIKLVWEGVAGWFKDNIINPIIGFLNGLIGAVESAINWVVGAANKLSFDIPEWLGGGTFGINLTPVALDRIPLLAAGAVIPPNSQFLAVLGDQKSGTNIEAPEALIRKIVREETGRLGNTEGTIHNVIKLDGQVLYDAFKKIDKRVGTSLVAGSGIR